MVLNQFAIAYTIDALVTLKDKVGVIKFRLMCHKMSVLLLLLAREEVGNLNIALGH